MAPPRPNDQYPQSYPYPNQPAAHPAYSHTSQPPYGGQAAGPPGSHIPPQQPPPHVHGYAGNFPGHLPMSNASAPVNRGYGGDNMGQYSNAANPYAHSFPPGPPPGQPPYQQATSGGQPSFSMMNPWSMISSVSRMGENVQASQEFVSSRVSWFTGGFFGQLFQVDAAYIRNKLTLLLVPYLKKYSYARSVDKIEGNVTIMMPPRADLFAPDLYIPTLAMFTYVVLSACNKFTNGVFVPDVVHSLVSWAVAAWLLNFAVIWVVVKMMTLSMPPSGLEILAYSGYTFVNFCLSILCGWVFGRGIGWYAAWLYTSLCMSIFLVRTFKSYILHSAPQPGVHGGGDTPRGSRRKAHIMLLMGGAQFVLSWLFLVGTTFKARTSLP